MISLPRHRFDGIAAQRLQCVHEFRLVRASQTPQHEKILQGVITLAVFVPFAMLYIGQGIKMNYLYAGPCLIGAVYFIFKS